MIEAIGDASRPWRNRLNDEDGTTTEFVNESNENDNEQRKHEEISDAGGATERHG